MYSGLEYPSNLAPRLSIVGNKSLPKSIAFGCAAHGSRADLRMT